LKVLIKLFQKFAQVEGAKPSSPPQRRNFPNAVFWFFFAAPCSKKNGEDHLNAIGMLFLKAGVENFFAGVHRTPLRV
jgi:hypothetical protein